MPNSKHRKKQLAANRRQIEKARKRLILQQEREKENESPGPRNLQNKGKATTSPILETRQQNVGEGSSWMTTVGSLYSWCHTGIVQVRWEPIVPKAMCIMQGASLLLTWYFHLLTGVPPIFASLALTLPKIIPDL